MTVFRDRFNNLWVGGFKSGASYASMHPSNIFSFLPSTRYPGASDVVYGISGLPGGSVIFGNHRGDVFALHPDRGSRRFIPQQDNPFYEINSIISSFHVDSRRDILWVGSMSGCLMAVPLASDGSSWKPMGRKFITFRGDTNFNGPAIHGWSVRSIQTDDQKRLWVGTWEGGLTCIDPVTWKRIKVLGAESLHGIRNIYRPLIDWSNTLLVCTLNGIVFLDTKTFEHVHIREFVPDHLPLDPFLTSFWGVYQESSDVFWFCTSSTGLIRMELSRLFMVNAPGKLNVRVGDVKFFHEGNGFPSNVIYGILPDEQGNLWISSEKGLVYFSTRDYKYKLYGRPEGLTHSEFNFGSFYKDSLSGLLFSGGIKAFLIFRRPGSRTGKSLLFQ